MSQKEFQRVKVIENAAGGRLSVREASRLLHLSQRQVQRLKRRYQPDSTDWVHHGNRGRSMPWAVSVPQQQLILTLARSKYPGFNDSHLTEKLHGEEILVIGDTPLDVACAKAIDARVLAVATGKHRREELACLQPDWAVESLGGVNWDEICA